MRSCLWTVERDYTGSPSQAITLIVPQHQSQQVFLKITFNLEENKGRGGVTRVYRLGCSQQVRFHQGHFEAQLRFDDLRLKSPIFVHTAALLASLNSDLQLTPAPSLQQLEVLLMIDGRLDSEANWCSDVNALPA